MIDFHRFVLPNGLRLIVNEDHSTPLVGVSLLYDVGSRDEHPERTGFAHLFEHLMFAGSKNAPDFDDPLQRAGGENNATTSTDQTNFYEVLPAENLETVLWLESDRMLALNISKKSFDVQRKVVVEEFKETCLNEPYGDYWHHLSDMAYQVHPYRWPVIGLVPEHIENATLGEVRDFYKKWYTPNNAIIAISGNVKSADALALVEKWFGEIPASPIPPRQLPAEPPHRTAQRRVVQADVPVPAIYLSFPTAARTHPDFYPADLLTDVLANGQSSRLYQRLLKERKIFSQIDAYLTATLDPGLLIIEGKPADGVSPDDALAAVWEELELLKREKIDLRELLKIQRRLESSTVFSELNVLNKCQSLTFYESLGDAQLVNTEIGIYLAATPEDLQRAANDIFQPEQSATLIYLPR